MTASHRPPRLPVQQLLILAICRFAEPIALSSVFPYLPEMIESFGVPTNEVSKWAGITSAVFSLSQAATGVLWGRAADEIGRKPVILSGMFSVMATSILYGFSKNLAWAIIARSLAGASNGNVGILRTTVAEMVPQKELQPRAFSIMPLVWTVGAIFGPGFGGALANPAAKYPDVFGQSRFWKEFPFALPNLVSSAVFLVGLSVGALFLKETLESKKHQRDYGRALGQLLLHPFKPKSDKRHRREEEPLLKDSRLSSSSSTNTTTHPAHTEPPIKPPTYREVFSPQSNINLLTYTLLALHSIAYDQLLPIFMHYPSHPRPHGLTLSFSNGFGLTSSRIGLIFVAYGIVGMLIQFLIFPPLARKWGVLYCLKSVSLIFPIVYILTPFTALLPTPLAQQIGVFAIMLFKCWAVIFAFPCSTILLTNSATSLRILGTLNGFAVSTSALGRAIGPAVGGWTFTLGVSCGYGILPWWTLAFFAILAAVPVWWLVELDGFNCGSESDDDDEDQRAAAEVLAQGTEERAPAIAIHGAGEDVVANGHADRDGEDLAKTRSRSTSGLGQSQSGHGTTS